ncbi:hypothetical protein [Iningainema tapete]|uniref:WxL domain-containing protein n=1 Tax=Iningainema tapete BLCC-T55 TaxID=2748662 RepID=A0A8J7CAE2_9CYAN|nr:hypothetical protein [Iningainema tapete]MBD2777031.1 hypothetical protein [Iningainema tapete BLCC-T55]
MFYRFAFTSSLLITSSIIFDQAALAQSVDVPFNGTVPAQATFSIPIFSTAEPTSSGDSGSNGKTFKSVAPTTISVQSSTPAKITISPPHLVSGPTPDPVGTTHIGFLQFGSTSVRSDVAGGTAALPTGNTNLQVDFLVERPEEFAPGTYTYGLTLTITP